MATEHKWVSIDREFAAPIDEVWAMWTEPQKFAQWYGPPGASVPHATMDLRPGGERKVCMAMSRGGSEHKMWFTGKFVEIEAPHTLVYTESMCSEDGTPIPPSAMGMPEGTPQFTQVVVQLAERNGGTHMTLVHEGVPEGSPAAAGWAGAFSKLEKALSA